MSEQEKTDGVELPCIMQAKGHPCPLHDEQEKTDQSRSDQPQLRAGESDQRGDHSGDSMRHPYRKLPRAVEGFEECCAECGEQPDHAHHVAKP